MGNTLGTVRTRLVAVTVLSALLGSLICASSALAVDRVKCSHVSVRTEFLIGLIGKNETQARRAVSQHMGYLTRVLSADGRRYSQPLITPKNVPRTVFLTLDKGLVSDAWLDKTECRYEVSVHS